MRRLYSSLSIFLLLVVVNVVDAVAQKDTTKLNQSVEVMKAYRPSISTANKLNLMPVTEDTVRFKAEFKYLINSMPAKIGFNASPISAADVNRQPSKNFGLGYLKLGIGTLSTPYGEFFLNLPKSEIATLALHLRHLSSDSKIRLRGGDLVEAPYSQNNGDLFGSINLGGTILSGELSYNRDAMLYYGYPVSIPANISILPFSTYGLKQAYQKGSLKVDLKNSDKSAGGLNFQGGFRLGFFEAETRQKETSGGFFGKFDYNFGQFTGIVNLSFDHLSTDSIFVNTPYTDTGTKSEDWIRIAPSVRLDGDNWSLRGGINFVTNSVKGGENISKLYPDFEFNFRPIEEIIAFYAGFKGDIINNSYGDIAIENFWADPRHNVHNTDYPYVLLGGIKGKISNQISYNFGLKYSVVKDLYFYAQSSFDDPSSSFKPPPVIYRNAFDLIYDNAGIFNLSAEFSFVSSKDLSVMLKGNYYNFDLESLPFAPNKPNFDLTASAGFKIIERLTGFSDFEVTGARKAMIRYSASASSSATPQAKEFSIDPSIRLNLGATYDLTGNFKLFGRVDNLLDRQNEQWSGYSSQGLRLMAGVNLSF
jgi:hypothetical protein